jgi:hypothetical protein
MRRSITPVENVGVRSGKKSPNGGQVSGQRFDHYCTQVSQLYRKLVLRSAECRVMDRVLTEIKFTKNSVFRGLEMAGILCLALVLGVLSLAGADDFLE